MPIVSPPRPQKRNKARQQSRGLSVISDADITSQLSTPEPPMAIPPIAKSTKRQHDAARDRFSEFLGEPRNVEVDGKVPGSFEGWLKLDIPFPTVAILKGYILWWITGAIGRIVELISATTVIAWYLTFCAVWRRATGVKVDKEKRTMGMRAVVHMIKEHGLGWKSGAKARLDLSSIRALQQCCLTPGWTWLFRKRYRLSILCFIALACQTACRPGAMVKPMGEPRDGDDNREGAFFGDFELWVSAAVTDGGPNDIHGYFRPRHGKTRQSRNKSFPLPIVTSSIMDSAPKMLLFSMYIDKKITKETLHSYFEPAYLSDQPRKRITMTPDVSSSRVFSMHNGRSMRTLYVTNALTDMSIHVGMEIPATAYSFRHAGAFALDQVGVPLEGIKSQLTHAPNGNSVLTYLGKGLMSVVGPILPEHEKCHQIERDRIFSIASQPNPFAPNTLNSAELEEIEQNEDLQQYKTERKRALEVDKSALSAEDSKKRQKTLTSLSGKENHLRKGLTKDKLADKRQAFFDSQRSAGPNIPSAQCSSSSTVDGSVPFQVHVDAVGHPPMIRLFTLLSRPPSDLLVIFNELIELVDICFGPEMKIRRTRADNGHAEDEEATDEEELDERVDMEVIGEDLVEELQDSFEE